MEPPHILRVGISGLVASPHRSKFFSILLTFFIISALMLSGPTVAIVLYVDSDQTVYNNIENGITFTVGVDIEDSETVPVKNITLKITGPVSKTCVFDPDGVEISGCEDITVVRNYTYECHRFNEELFGFGYGYNPPVENYTTENKTFGNGSGYTAGSGFNWSQGNPELFYTIHWSPEISQSLVGEYTAKLKAFAENDNESRVYATMDSNLASFTITSGIFPPQITIQNPLNITYTTLPIDVDIVTDETADQCWYNLDSGQNTSMSGSGTSWHASLNPSDGTHNLYVYCNDTYGNTGSNTSLFFTYDSPPKHRNDGSNTTTPLEGEAVLMSAELYDMVGLDWAWLSINETGMWVNYTSFVTQFNDSSSEKNVTFSDAGNQTVYVRLPKDEIVQSAYLNLTGYYVKERIEAESSRVDNPFNWPTFSRGGSSGGATRDGNNIGEWINIDFTANRIDFIYLGAPDSGRANFTINGSFMETFDTYNSPYQYQMEHTVKNYLSPSPHNLTVTVAGAGQGSDSWIMADAFDLFNYSNSPYLDVGNDGDVEWSYSGIFNHTERTSNFAFELNGALNGGACDCTGCSLQGNYCTIPLVIHSDTTGIIELSSLSIEFKYGPINLNASDSWTLVNFTWHNNSASIGTTIGWRIYYNDTYGSINSTDIHTFTIIENAPPRITIQNPINTTYTTSINLNITTNETADQCWYNLDNGQNITMSGSGTSWHSSISPSDGTHNLHVYCNDSYGNTGSNTSLFFTYDSPPNITIFNPLNTTYTSLPIILNVSVNKDVDTCLWNLDNGTNYSAYRLGLQWLSLITCEMGHHRVYVYCNDSFGIWGSSSEDFSYALASTSTSTSTTTTTGGGGGGTECKEKWKCTPWSKCVNGIQKRKCVDLNNCGVVKKKPKEVKSCESTVKSKKTKPALFDINVELLKQEVNNELVARIGLINFGGPGLVNATVHYTINDSYGNILYNETEVIPVEAQTEYLKSFDISSLKDGEYTLSLSLEYEGQTEPAKTERAFTVKRGVPGEGYVSLLTLFLSGFFISTIAYLKREEIFKLEKKAYSYKPKKKRAWSKSLKSLFRKALQS